jgi:hypothetical protein
MLNENKYKYLVLLLSAKEVHLYIYDKVKFEKIKLSNADASAHKEILVDKFLHHIDIALGDVLNQYPNMPLFILGTKRITGHFNQLTKHAKAVTEYIDGNYNESTLHELKEKLAHHILALDFVK